MSHPTTIGIECRCGAVAVTLSGDPLAQFFCHCDDCQIVHGAAFVPVALYRADSVRITRGSPSSWQLRTTPRTTCRECGTRIYASPPGAAFRGVTAYLLPASSFRPSFHIYCAFALRPVKDDLPHYRTVPASFGGSDALVDW